MAAPVIPISSDSSEESVGSHVPDCIEGGSSSVTHPTGVLDLVDYSSILILKPSRIPHSSTRSSLVLPSYVSDDRRQTRDRVASRPSSPPRSSPHDTLAPSSEFPLAPVVAPLRIRWRPVILVQTGKAIPFGRPYRTQPNGPRKFLTARKRVGPFPARRLAWRHTSSGSPLNSLSNSSSVHSSGCDTSGFYALKVCTIVYSLPTDSISKSSLDSSSESPILLLDILPPRKGSEITIHLRRDRRDEHMDDWYDNVEAVVDLGIGDGDRAPTEDGIGMGVEVAATDIREDEEEYEAEASAGGTMEIAIDPLVTGGISESIGGDVPDLEGTLYDIAHYMFEVDSLRRHMALSQEEFCQIRRDCDDTRRRLRRLESLVERRLGFRCYFGSTMIMNITCSGMTLEVIEELINQRVAETLATYEANRAANLVVKSQSQNGEDGNNKNGGGNRNGNGGGNGNGNRGGNGNGIPMRID
ncbi:hypothetical protein Tco_0408805 [Tanacetum coccineum]